MTDLTGRVALVTGGSRGLGAEIVRALAREGADVALTYVNNPESAEAVVGEVRALGRRALSIRADAADFRRAHEVVAEVTATLRSLHLLVCNAGLSRSGALWKLSESDWDDVVAVSLKGAFNYIHAAAPYFINQRSGRVVCIGSINGLRGRIGSASYNAAKAGLVGLVKTTAAELGQYGVTANVVAPGFIETVSQERTPELVRKIVLDESAIKRLGTPQDIVPIVVFLSGDDASHITGQTFRVDAGQYL